MGDKSQNKGKGKKKGSLGGKLVLALVVLGIGVGAAWYLDPELVRAQWSNLRGLAGL